MDHFDQLRSFFTECLDINKMCDVDIDDSVEIEEVDKVMLRKYGQSLRFQESGYKDVEIIKKAIALLGFVRSWKHDSDADWAPLFEYNISWTTLGLIAW